MKENKFNQLKKEFDSKYLQNNTIESCVPHHLTKNKIIEIKNIHNEPNEFYYKYQLLYILIYGGYYYKETIGVEVEFPKGNKNSSSIILDCAIFKDKTWFDHYKNWHEHKNYDSLEWLRNNLIVAIEIKKEDSKDIESAFKIQLRSYMNESQRKKVLGIIYDTGRLYLFKKDNNTLMRFNENLNKKSDTGKITDFSLEIPDPYNTLPSIKEFIHEKNNLEVYKRTIDDLDVISGVHSQSLNDNIFQILKVMDKESLNSLIGYEILIQMIAVKLYDEKTNEDFLKDDTQDNPHYLNFYIENEAKQFKNLSEKPIQKFISRIKKLYDEASEDYFAILNKENTTYKISFKNESHIRVISEIVYQFQNYSFKKSEKTDLYQLVFYKFGNEFSKTENAQFITPIDIIDFLVKIINPKIQESIVDPTVGIGDFLSVSYVNSNSKLKDSNLYGVDNNEYMIMLAQLNMLLNGDGNAKLKFQKGKGSLSWKFNKKNELSELNPEKHYNGNWDEWDDDTELKKFDIVLTNPPFGNERSYSPDEYGVDLLKCYETYNIFSKNKKKMPKIDPGIIFLENAYRILKPNGRLGIILSNSIVSIDQWSEIREWLMNKMRIVALFDLPSNVFTDTGVNTSLLIAYKPSSEEELNKLISEDYSIFVKNIENVGYKVKTKKRVKYFRYNYKIDENFEKIIDEEGNLVKDEDFTETIDEFRKWMMMQEQTLIDLFG